MRLLQLSVGKDHWLWEYTNPSEILFLAISVLHLAVPTEREKEKKLPEKLRKHRRNLFLFTFAVVKYASGNTTAFTPLIHWVVRNSH